MSDSTPWLSPADYIDELIARKGFNPAVLDGKELCSLSDKFGVENGVYILSPDNEKIFGVLIPERFHVNDTDRNNKRAIWYPVYQVEFGRKITSVTDEMRLLYSSQGTGVGGIIAHGGPHGDKTIATIILVTGTDIPPTVPDVPYAGFLEPNPDRANDPNQPSFRYRPTRPVLTYPRTALFRMPK